MAPRVIAPFPRSSTASPAASKRAARSASSGDRSRAALSCTGTDSPSQAAWPCSGTSDVVVAAAANPLAGWARAIAAASGRARYNARCAHASAGTPAGSGGAAVSGTAITWDAVTSARSAAGVISMTSPARADTCPYAVTSPSRASTFAASATSAPQPRSPSALLFPDGQTRG